MSYSIEVLRVISTFFIVVFHTNPIAGKQFFYSGLIYFVLVSIYLNFKTVPKKQYLYIYFTRLILPWFVWCAMYAVGNKYIHGYFYTSDELNILKILRGPKTHLWYLPFIFIVLIITTVQLKKFNDLSVYRFSIFMYVLIMVTSIFWRPISLKLPEPLPQYFHIIPAVFASLAITKCVNENFIKTIIVLFSTTFFSFGFEGVFVPYFVGLTMFIIVFLYPLNLQTPFKQISFLSKQSMGIYLVHPAFLHFLDSLKIYLGWYFPVAVYLCSFFFICGVKKLVPSADKIC